MADICFPKKNNLLSVEQAIAEIRHAIDPISEQDTIDLDAAQGRILCQSIASPMNIPPDRNAAMDGYAFSAQDLANAKSSTLQIVGTAWAGQPFLGEMARGECVRIFTGAVVPASADSVVPQEQIVLEGGTVTFPPDLQPFKNIRAAGSDVKQHEVLIDAPKKLNACDLSLLAAAGINRIEVKRKLKIGYFSTGDELLSLDHSLAVGKIYDSNRYLLSGLLADPNHTISNLGIVRDDPEVLENTLKCAAKQFDVIISTGGASVGDADFVKQTLEKCGQVNFWKLAIKPGKPLAFGKIADCWFFGLPGNPIAVLVTYQKFVKPGLEQLLGAPASKALQLRVRCQSQLKKSPGRQEYQRGILSQAADGQLIVRLAGQQDSHQLKVASQSNCFIVLDADTSDVKQDEWVTVEPFTAIV